MSELAPLQHTLFNFQALRKENYFYVDKTQYIAHLFDWGGRCFFARPRKFGKSLMLSTIKNLFLGNRHLFDGLAIAEHLDNPRFQPHPVIHIDFSGIATLEEDDKNKIKDKDIDESIITIKSSLLNKICKIASFHNVDVDKNSPYTAFNDVICNTAEKNEKNVVLLIDEYDLLLNETFNIPKYQNKIRGLLRNFYKNIKDCEEYIHLCYITGISKFSELGIFSVANGGKVTKLLWTRPNSVT
jgi:hypothetical protein